MDRYIVTVKIEVIAKDEFDAKSHIAGKLSSITKTPIVDWSVINAKKRKD